MTDVQVEFAKKLYKMFVEAQTLADPEIPEPKRWGEMTEVEQKSWILFGDRLTIMFPNEPPDLG